MGAIMFDLEKINLGNDEAEQDERLREYFIKTAHYENTISGNKTIIIGRKGSGKSAIFTLAKEQLEKRGDFVISITPMQYSFNALKDYKETGITAEQAHANAWKITLLSSIVWILNEKDMIPRGSKLVGYYKYMKDAYIPSEELFQNIVQKAKNALTCIKSDYVSFDFEREGTPIRVINEIQDLLHKDWPSAKCIRILIDRLDESWDASEDAKYMIISLLRAANQINGYFKGRVIVTVFLRSDIYEGLYFEDQDKLRQNEEVLRWDNEDLKAVVCERVRVSLNLGQEIGTEEIWDTLFSKVRYRSKATAEKYIIDRTFKRPRDMISFVRLALEVAKRNHHSYIERKDTRTAEEESYGQSKYKDLIIENQKQYPYVKDLLDFISSSLNKQSRDELLAKASAFIDKYGIREKQSNQLLRQLFQWGVIGVEFRGGTGITHKGGTRFVYYYENPSINPLNFKTFCIHPSLKYPLNIREKREIETANFM
jgi:hypothetical protein